MSEDEARREKKVRLPKWRPQGPDAAVVARAYWAGTLDTSIESYRKFLDANQSLAQHYGVNLQKGRRNLRANILRLINRIQYWKDHVVDPKTGNYVKFSPSFLKKGNFPPRPEIVDDVPQEQLQNFQPGRDSEYEDVIAEEREEEIEKKSQASESETVVPFLTTNEDDNNGEDINRDDNNKDKNKDENKEDNNSSEEDPNDNDNSFNLKLPSFIEDEKKKTVRFTSPPPPKEINIMTDSRGKLIGDTSQLEPVFAEMKGNDPDWQIYGEYHTRDILLVRFLIPDGFEETSLKTKIINGGTVLMVTASMILSKFAAKYTIGSGLRSGPNGTKITLALARELTTIYSDLPRSGEGLVEKRWKIELPVAVKKEARNPNQNWIRCRPGTKGFVSICSDARSTFCFLFYFAKEKEGRVNPHDQTGNFMDISHEEYDTRIGLARLSLTRQEQMGKMYEARARNMVPNVGGNQRADESFEEETLGDVSMASRRSRRSRGTRGGTTRRSNVLPGMDINVNRQNSSNRPTDANTYVPNPSTASPYDPRRSVSGVVEDDGLDTDIEEDTRRSRSRSNRRRDEY